MHLFIIPWEDGTIWPSIALRSSRTALHPGRQEDDRSEKLTLRFDKQVSLSGTSVNNGGNLTVEGEKVVLSNGFSVKAGGSLSVNDI